MRLLVTRAEEDAAPLAARLKALGHEPVLCPLFEIHDRVIDRERLSAALADAAGLAFTSANGVRALSRAWPQCALPAFCVGAATAEAARAAGFAEVVEAGGTAESLAEVIAARRPGAVLHIAGRDRAGDLAGLLRQAGLQAERLVLYEARAAQALPEPARKALSSASPPEGVLLFSPRTAHIFRSCLAGAGLEDALPAMRAYCLSQAVMEAADTGWAARCVAETPNMDALLALLPRASSL